MSCVRLSGITIGTAHTRCGGRADAVRNCAAPSADGPQVPTFPFDQGCAFCGHHDVAELRTFATADRVYRVTRCLKCERYLKVLDTHVAGRALLPFYDPVATLPLDAAMMQG